VSSIRAATKIGTVPIRAAGLLGFFTFLCFSPAFAVWKKGQASLNLFIRTDISTAGILHPAGAGFKVKKCAKGRFLVAEKKMGERKMDARLD
jgi:hypothetical protein